MRPATMTPTPAPHRPALLERVTQLLVDAPDGLVVDATLGAGGHAAAVLAARRDRHGTARLLGLDRDPHALALAGQRLAELDADPRVAIERVRVRFDGLGDILDERGQDRVAGVLLDLGLSSMHVDQPERGFSYRHDGPLDMRMDPDLERSAADLLDELEVGELTRLLATYGDERFASRVARAIVAARPLRSTTALAEVVRQAIPAATRRSGGHPATRTFQALRIAVNEELDALAAALPVVIDRLAPGGVIVVLSYHSLEDRLVKRALADAARGCVCPPGLPVCACGHTPLIEHLVRRPERPDETEIVVNPRAAAARLRAARRIEEGPVSGRSVEENPRPREEDI